MPKENKNLLLWIQSLRGIAALLVVYTHARYFLPGELGQAIAQEVLRPAAMGVDLFFLLSGFIMVITTRDFDYSTRYAWRFILKRFARIWPLYAVVCLYAYAFGRPVTAVPVTGSRFGEFFDSLLFIPTDPQVALTFGMPVPVAWTLSFEFYFYVVFGASMLFGRWRWVAMAIWFFLTLIAYPWATGSLSYHVLTQKPIEWFRFGNVIVNPIVWDFVLGMLSGWLYVSKIRIYNLLTLRLGVLLSCAIVLWASYSGLVDIHGPAGWGGPLFLLMVNLALLSKEEEISLPAWSVWLGGVSYSLYLTHLIAFGLTSRAVTAIGLPSPDKTAVGLFILAPAVAVVLAAMVYYFVESPLSNKVRTLLLNLRLTKRNERPVLQEDRASR